MGDLQAHYTALATNTNNYAICINKLEKIGDIPQFWQDFIQQSRDRDLAQIQTHLDYLSPTQATFQQAIDTIRGTVEIEQAEIDRASEKAIEKRQNKLESLIFTVSTGLAISGISSQVIGEPTRILRTQNTELPKLQSVSAYWIYGTFDVLFHLIIGIIPATIVGFILHKIKKW